MAAKKHTFDIGTLSSAIDKISMQGSKVFINFSGNEKTYEYKWKPANRDFLTALDGFVKNPESFSLGRFYNDSLKNGDLVQTIVQYTLTTKGTQNGQKLRNSQKEQFLAKKEGFERNGRIGRKWSNGSII